ncbi:MAG: hypothetical protein WCY62_00725 [Clostridia bacterium]
MDSKGSITLEASVCSVVFIFLLMFFIHIIGYVDTTMFLKKELDKRLLDTSLTHYMTGVYWVDVMTCDDITNVKNITFCALPYEDCYTMKISGTYCGILAEHAITVASVIPAWKGDGITETENSIWDDDPWQRGIELHSMMGSNLDPDFPILDIYDEYTGEATAIISLNTTDESYLTGYDLKKKIKTCVDELDGYETTTYGDLTIEAADIEKKKVMLVIPNDPLNDHQSRQIEQMIQYAENMGIELKVKKYQNAD